MEWNLRLQPFLIITSTSNWVTEGERKKLPLDSPDKNKTKNPTLMPGWGGRGGNYFPSPAGAIPHSLFLLMPRLEHRIRAQYTADYLSVESSHLPGRALCRADWEPLKIVTHMKNSFYVVLSPNTHAYTHRHTQWKQEFHETIILYDTLWSFLFNFI